MEKKVYDKTRISMCCQAPVFVGGDDREGTHYYICEKCNKPCDSEGLNTDILFRELDKAREEGRRENYNAQLEEIEMSRNEERKRTLTEVIKLFDARREEGLSEMWVVDEIVKRLKVIKLKDNK
jgi:hypothetical protein